MTYFAATRSTQQTPQSARSITGFALWDTLLLVALIAALLVVAFVSQQAYLKLRTTQQQAATMLWADQQVAGFAVSHRRLPCPDVNGDGLEDCAAGVTVGATLPLLTLGVQADAAVRGPIHILYTIGSHAMDLTVLASYFEPQQWDGTKYAYGTANGLDFCGKLADIVKADATTAAYSVGLKRQDGESNLVRTHSAADISNSLSCVTTMSSVNGIALAVDVVNEVLDQQQSTHDAAVMTIAFNVLHILLAGIDVAMSAVGLVNAIATEAEASTELAGAIASCIVLVGCAFIPVFSAAVAAAGVAIALFGVAIGLGAAGIIAVAAATVIAADVANKTGEGGTANPPLQIDLGYLEAAATNAENQATDAENKRTAAYNTMNDKANDRDNKRAYAIALAEFIDPSLQSDAVVVTALADAVTLDNAILAQSKAQGDFDQANKMVNNAISSLASAQAACAGTSPPAPPALVSKPPDQSQCAALPTLQNKLAAAAAALAPAQATLDGANQQLNADQIIYNNALQAVYDAFDQIQNVIFQPSDVTAAIEDYRKAYSTWQQAVNAYYIQVDVAAKARSSATQARDAYNQAKYAYDHPGSVPTTTSGIVVWAGAEAILKQADANGVVQ